LAVYDMAEGGIYSYQQVTGEPSSTAD